MMIRYIGKSIHTGLLPRLSLNPLFVILVALFVFAAGSIVLPNMTSATDAAEASCYGNTYVRGYTRSNGTYVRGHYRTCPDSRITNNYSYPGNYNPNTGSISRGSRNSYTSNYGSSNYGFRNSGYSSYGSRSNRTSVFGGYSSSWSPSVFSGYGSTYGSSIWGR
jgi:hypothetical protein